MKEFLKRLLFGLKMSREEKVRYRWVLRNIRSCASYEETIGCERWVETVTGLKPFVKHRLRSELVIRRAILRKRGNATTLPKRS